MIVPRPYQAESVFTLIPNSFRTGHTSVIRYAPMRSGKSIEQSLMTKGAYDKGGRVILLTHRFKIFRSTLRHLGNAGVPCVEFVSGSKIPPGDWKVMLAMERSLWNAIVKNPDAILQPTLLIIDEVHLRNFTKIIDFFKARATERGVKLFVVGFSGTPKGKHLHKYFSEIIINVDSQDLIASGDLVPCKAYQAQDEDVEKIKRDKKGEFDPKAMFEHYDKPKRYDGLINEYKDKCLGKKGIVFCCDIEHTVKTYEAFKAAGVNAFMCHSGNKVYKMTEGEKESMISGFESSSDGVMINQGILDTGYDHPPMQWVAVDRATTSLQLWLQMASRAATPYPGKTSYVLLDFGMNHTRHGLVHQPRKWELKEPKKKKEQAAPVKTCPQCSAMVYASARICPHCEHEFPAPTFELREGVMCEVGTNIPLGVVGKKLSELTTEELMLCVQSERIKPTYAWRILRTKEKTDGSDVLTEYAKKMGYSNGWLWHQRSKMDDVTQVGFKDMTIS